MGNSPSQTHPTRSRSRRVPSLILETPAVQQGNLTHRASQEPPTAVVMPVNNNNPLPPPPYTPVDENPSPVLPNSSNRRVQRAATSARSNTSSSTDTANSSGSNQHRRTVSAVASVPRSPTHHSTRHGHRASLSPPTNSAANVGGFRAEMTPGTRHAHLSVVPPVAPRNLAAPTMPQAAALAAASPRTPTRRNSREDPLEFLK
jgi:hypothetical protein